MPLWQPIDSILNQIIWRKYCDVLGKGNKTKVNISSIILRIV